MKIKSIILLSIFFSLCLHAGVPAKEINTVDTYTLKFSKDTNCTLTKNSVPIALFDKRFKRKSPNNGYTCSAIQKEQYHKCRVINSSGVTAQVLAFGVYENTNLVIAFKNPFPTVKSVLTVKCTK